jgi:ribosomal protein L19E
MPSTSVYSIRIDSRVRKMIEELNDPNMQEEIRILIEHSVRKKRKDQILSRARDRNQALMNGAPSSEYIREDRDAR